MKIYIAGPYTHGDVAQNVRAALDAAEALRNLGHTPFVPHLTHFWHLVYPHALAFWYAYDSEWLLCCDAVLRLPGESNGADNEVTLAQKLEKPIYTSLQEIPANTNTPGWC